MSIEFSDHSLKQLKARKIPRSRVLSTIKNPEKKLKSFKNRRLRQKRFGSKILEVVTIAEGPRITIVTAYYLERKDEN